MNTRKHTTGKLVAEHGRVPSGRAVPALVLELSLALGDAQARALFNARQKMRFARAQVLLLVR